MYSTVWFGVNTILVHPRWTSAGGASPCRSYQNEWIPSLASCSRLLFPPHITEIRDPLSANTHQQFYPLATCRPILSCSTGIDRHIDLFPIASSRLCICAIPRGLNHVPNTPRSTGNGGEGALVSRLQNSSYGKGDGYKDASTGLASPNRRQPGPPNFMRKESSPQRSH